MCHHFPSGTRAPVAQHSWDQHRKAAVASHNPHGKVLLFPISYGILVFPLPSHLSAFSHGLRRYEPLTTPWKWKKEKGKCTQTMEIPVFPFLLKHRRFQAYGKHPFQTKRHLLLHSSVVGIPSGSRCLSGHHHHPEDAVAGAGGAVELTGTQGQAQWHLDDARPGGDGLWDPSMGPCCSQPVLSPHPAIPPGFNLDSHFIVHPKFQFFFSQLCSD